MQNAYVIGSCVITVYCLKILVASKRFNYKFNNTNTANASGSHEVIDGQRYHITSYTYYVKLFISQTDIMLDRQTD